MQIIPHKNRGLMCLLCPANMSCKEIKAVSIEIIYRKNKNENDKLFFRNVKPQKVRANVHESRPFFGGVHVISMLLIRGKVHIEMKSISDL